MFIFAGIIAALLSYLCNKAVLRKSENTGITIVIPCIEEMTKTISALAMNTSIIKTHFIFGIIEGIYDIATSSKAVGRWAALASIISHSLFGLVTYFSIKNGYSFYWGIFLAWLIHSTWNWYITKYL